MTDLPWRQQFIEAAKRDQPALTTELGRLHFAQEPNDRTALLLYGDALVGLGRYAEARAAFEHALSLSAPEERRRPLQLLAQLYDARYEAREAERYYREAIAAAPEHASAYIFLGALLAKMGRLEEAEVVHRRATECSEGEIDEAYLNLGLVQRGRGDYVAALGSLRHALSLDPTDTAVQEALADVETVLFRFPAPEA
jgi:tetratricopeptide (TPR) repeat protein